MKKYIGFIALACVVAFGLLMQQCSSDKGTGEGVTNPPVVLPNQDPRCEAKERWNHLQQKCEKITSLDNAVRK